LHIPHRAIYPCILAKCQCWFHLSSEINLVLTNTIESNWLLFENVCVLHHTVKMKLLYSEESAMQWEVFTVEVYCLILRFASSASHNYINWYLWTQETSYFICHRANCYISPFAMTTNKPDALSWQILQCENSVIAKFICNKTARSIT